MINSGSNVQIKLETIEKLATKPVFSWLVMTLVFGFFFISSCLPENLSGKTLVAASLGAVDLKDAITINDITSAVDDMDIIKAPNLPDQGLFYLVYKVVKGDTISEIASRYGVSTDSIVTFNDISNARALSIGKYLKIPTINGILYKTKDGDTAAALSESYSISQERIMEINGIGNEALQNGIMVFLPDARLSSWVLREISGDLFLWPIRGYITSWYGWRNDPFTGSRSFHTGIDIGAARGTPIKAAMEGTVSATGYSTVSGNYVVIRHHSGYSSMYAHLDRIDVKAGARVSQASVIGIVGSTGYSTGPHLHFTVSKNGITMNPMTVLH
ncbi:hypothetical protein MASR2M29_09170 [Spirochaetota bacterium]